MDSFKLYIETKISTSIDEEHYKEIIDKFESKKYPQKTLLLKPGEISRYSYFVLKGAMRLFSLDNIGKENTIRLAIDNWWIGDRDSFTNQKPSKLFLELTPKTIVLRISFLNYQILKSLNPIFQKLLIVLDEKSNIAQIRRLESTLRLTPENKYGEFIRNYPYFIEKFPLYIIASYLGLSRETLSRVRRTMVNRK